MTEINAGNNINPPPPIRMISPLVAYEFPCSYLGTPRPIESTTPSASLGVLSGVLIQGNNPGNDHRDSKETATANFTNGTLLFSCPRRTIDGITSETILESEGTVADLRALFLAKTLSSSANAGRNETVRASPSLAMEVWFTPFVDQTTMEEQGGHDERLLPIVSFAAPLSGDADGNEVHTSDGSRSSFHGGPCENRQLMVGQRGSFLELRYRDHYEYLGEELFGFDDDDDDDDDFYYSSNPQQYACRVLRLTQWKLGAADETTTDSLAKKLHHLVVAWNDSRSTLKVFGNGKSIVNIDLLQGYRGTIETNTNADLLRHWDPSYRLQLYSDSVSWSSGTRSVAEGTPTTLKSVASKDKDAKGSSSTDSRGLFPGAIHEVALYHQRLDENAVKVLYEEGVKKRKDPFRAFFQDINNPFEPLLLVASPQEEDPAINGLADVQGVIVVQGGSSSISLGASIASNETTPLWDVLVELMDLPRYGDLFRYDEKEGQPGDGYLVKALAGDRILLEEGELRTSIEYKHMKDDYFSVPARSFYGKSLPSSELPGESFSYRLIATKKGGSHSSTKRPSVFLGRSEVIQQNLTILHQNHQPHFLGIPGEVLPPEWQPTDAGARPWATLGKDVVLSDEKDHDIDRVRCDLWAHNGTLNIDLEITELRRIAEITDCSNPSTSGSFSNEEWICNGQNDRNMTLRATPTDISRILSNLRYTALHWDTSDSIVLRVFDGSGSPCIGHDGGNGGSLLLSNRTTVRDECFRVSASIRVPPMARPEGKPSGSLWRDHGGWWISLFVFVGILSLTCCCAIGCWRKCTRDKQRNNVAVADCDQHVVLAPPEGDFPSTSLWIRENDREKATASRRNASSSSGNGNGNHNRETPRLVDSV